MKESSKGSLFVCCCCVLHIKESSKGSLFVSLLLLCASHMKESSTCVDIYKKL